MYFGSHENILSEITICYSLLIITSFNKVSQHIFAIGITKNRTHNLCVLLHYNIVMPASRAAWAKFWGGSSSQTR